MDRSDILKAIEPKSDQLNADDLIAGPIDVTIKAVKRGNAEQPIAIVIDGGHKPYRPAKCMTRLMVKVWGGDPNLWVGQGLRLYCDPNVKWAGVAVGGIRISHVTGIENPLEIALTVSRSKREIYRIEPLVIEKPNLDDRIEKAIEVLNKSNLERFFKYWGAIERDLLPYATIDQKTRLYIEAISVQTDVEKADKLRLDAIEQGCNADDVDAVFDALLDHFEKR
jgi:hypothetical protein